MILRLKELAAGPCDFDLRFEPNWWGAGDPYHQVQGFDGPLEVHLTLSRDGDHYAVAGALSGRLWVLCDRCAEPYSQGITSNFGLILRPMSPESGSSELALSEEDMAVEFFTGDEIEIDHLVREQIYLSLPIKFLCDEGCKGLCHTCGVNLNCKACKCTGKSGHPAFLKLKGLNIARGSKTS